MLDSFSPQIHGSEAKLPADLRDNVRLVRGDVRDAGIWASTVPGHQAIVNLAAETGTGQSMYEVTKYEQVNVAGTALLYDLLAKSPSNEVERIVVASSRAIYGEGAYNCLEHGLVYPGSRTSRDKMKGPTIRGVQSAAVSALRLLLRKALLFSHRHFMGLPSRYRSR